MTSLFKRYGGDWRKFWDGFITKPGLGSNLRPSDYDVVGAFKHINKYMKFGFGDGVLDAGCGTGFMTKLIGKRASMATGVDFSSGAIRVAKRYSGGGGITYEVGDISNLPYVDGVYTKIISGGVFQYFNDVETAGSALNELVRVCRDGGLIMLYDLPDKHKMTPAEGLTTYDAETLCAGLNYKVVESFFEPERRFDVIIKK